MGTEKRERQKAGQAARRAQQASARKRASYKKVAIRAAVIALLVTGVLVLMNVFSDDDSSPAPTTTQATPTTVARGTECPEADGSSPQTLEFDARPPICIDATATYTAVLDTSAGEITLELDPDLDLESVNNVVTLARWHYYDGSTFHRVIDDFMIQGGDPTGDPPGSGGPGYSFTGADPAAAYEIGSVAMANRADPSSNGAQFFIVTGQQGVDLPPLYSLLGQVSAGIEVAQQIETVATGDADKPVEDVTINSVTITENPA